MRNCTLVTQALAWPPGPATCVNPDNPRLTDLVCVFVRVINILLGISGAVAFILIVIGGIKLLTAGGDPKAMTDARRSLTFAILGFILVIGAIAIVNLLGNLLGVSDLTEIRIGE